MADAAWGPFMVHSSTKGFVPTNVDLVIRHCSRCQGFFVIACPIDTRQCHHPPTSHPIQEITCQGHIASWSSTQLAQSFSEAKWTPTTSTTIPSPSCAARPVASVSSVLHHLKTRFYMHWGLGRSFFTSFCSFLPLGHWRFLSFSVLRP